MKKVVMIIVCLMVFFCFAGFTYSPMKIETGMGQSLTEKYFENLEASMEIYENVINEFKLEKVEDANMPLVEGDINSCSEEQFIYTEEYAGCYLDESGDLNLMLVESVNDGNNSLNENINILNATFSYNELFQIKEILSDSMIELGISSIGISQQNNVVDIYLEDAERENLVIDFLKDYCLYERNSINFLQEEEIIKNSSEALAGTQTYYNYGFLWLSKASGTIGANAIDNQTGEKGIITNAHVAVEDKTMKHSNGTIGTRTKGWHSGTIDAAFVPFNNQNNWDLSGDATWGDESVSYGNVRLGSEDYIVEGYPTTKIDYTSGENDGYIVYTDYNCTLSYDDETDTTISNCFYYSNQSLSGDSGGPVYFNGGTKGSKWLIGLNFAGPVDTENYSFGIGCRITNVIDELDVTIITYDNKYTLWS